MIEKIGEKGNAKMLLYIGLIVTLAAIVGLSIWSGSRAKQGGKLSSPVAAVIAGPAVVLVFGLWKVLPFDSLFAGIGIALLIMFIGLLQKKPTV